MNTLPTIDAAMQTAHRLNAARARLVDANARAVSAEAELAYARAEAEQTVVDRVNGDEKKLGTNEDARRRTYLLALEQDAGYQAARAAHLIATTDREQAGNAVKHLGELYSLLLAALEHDTYHIDAEYLDGAEHDPQEAGVPMSKVIRIPILGTLDGTTTFALPNGYLPQDA